MISKITRETVNDLIAFLAVARERSFTRAAAKLGVSQSALSHTIRHLEARLGLRLLTRTTRNVSPTEAGERLLQNIGPRFEEIDAELLSLSDLRDRPSGTIRLTTSDYVLRQLLWPKLMRFMKSYPDVRVEVITENALSDIVEQRYDAGIRFGEQVAKDMISVRIGPDVRFAVVGAPSYLEGRKVPEVPPDLVNHSCINLRLQTFGGLYAWEFEKDDRELKVRVDGQCVFSSIYGVLDAALAGLGLAHMPEELARPHIEAGRLCRVLEDWCPYWSGFHIYYTSRRQPSAAFALLIDALRHRSGSTGSAPGSEPP